METKPRFTVEQNVGRLFEARVFRLATPDDVAAYAREFPGRRFTEIEDPVLVADHRKVVIYPQKVTDAIVELFRTMNAHWKRVAIVVAPSNATLGMQLSRLVKASHNPTRQVFFDAPSALAFLGELLVPAEVARAKAFLASGNSNPPSR